MTTHCVFDLIRTFECQLMLRIKLQSICDLRMMSGIANINKYYSCVKVQCFVQVVLKKNLER